MKISKLAGPAILMMILTISQDLIATPSLIPPDSAGHQKKKQQQAVNVTAGISYTSHVAYWGRSFGVNQYGMYPYLSFNNGKGLNAYVVGLYWSAIPGQLTETDFGAGFGKFITDDFYAYAGYERWLTFYGNSYSRKSLTNFLESDFSYNTGPFYVDPRLYFMFGKDQAFVADISVNSEYSLFPTFLKSAQLTVDPEIVTTFATRSLIFLFGYTPSSTSGKGFGLTGFELDAPLSLRYRKFKLTVSPHFDIPVKLKGEYITSRFYISADVNYKVSL